MKAVIIGGDAAGMSAASQIKRQQPDWDVIVFEMGTYISYAACGTPYYVEGLVQDLNALVEVTPEEAREKRKIDLRLNHQVMRILPAEKKVVVQNETETFEEEYDKLMIATGARPNTLDINIEEYEDVFTINNLVDAEKMREYILRKKPSRMAVIGGGFIGIEMAEAIHEQGIETIHIHRREDLNRSFEKEISDIIKKKLSDSGVQLKFNHAFKGIRKNTSDLSIVTNKDEIKADAVVLALGVIPNNQLASDAGIALGINNAIAVNEFLETSIADIYASGDCATARVTHFNLETHTPLALKANKQGMIGGINMCGGKEKFPGVLNSSITKVFDMGVSRTGLTAEEGESLGLEPTKIVIQSRDKARYYPGSAPFTSLLIISKKDRRIIGAQLTGNLESVKRIDVYSTMIYNKMTIDQAFELDLAYAPPFSPVYDPVLLAARVARKKV